MIEFTVNDMTCNHCVATLTKALRAIEPTGRVEVDLGRKRVRVEGAASAETVAQAIRDAGYTPQPVA